MVFSSQVFLFYFLPVALLCYYALPQRARNGFFALISYAFYAWANPWFVLLMFGSTALDWFCGLALDAPGASSSK
ncbi:MAG: alginate O-acetyltransferase complex protein AlgI, partial [Planctomycetota bacterium]